MAHKAKAKAKGKRTIRRALAASKDVFSNFETITACPRNKHAIEGYVQQKRNIASKPNPYTHEESGKVHADGDDGYTVPRRWRNSGRPARPSKSKLEQPWEEVIAESFISTRPGTGKSTKSAPTSDSIIFPPHVWVLELPEAVTSTPSLMTLTHDELCTRGFFTTRPTSEATKIQLPFAQDMLSRSKSSTSSSFQSALSNFAPYPYVIPLLPHHEISDSESENKLSKYPEAVPLVLIILGICISVFLISLDRSIITTAIPSIVAEFHSYSDIGWYGSAYLLTASAFQPLYGRVYTSFDVKWSFLTALAIFKLGSLICAVSASSKCLIIGRAVQGLGSAGILTGSFVVGTHSVRLDQRPVLFASVGVLYSTGTLVGPILGGVFSQTSTWRWCFYLNLLAGSFSFGTIFLFFKTNQRDSMNIKSSTTRQAQTYLDSGKPMLKRLLALDWIGNALYTAACTSLFLALQWSQQEIPDWSSGRYAAAISLSVGMFIAFAIWLWWQGDEALIPLHVLRQRTVAVSCASTFFIYGALLIHTYYLPIWFQAIKGQSAMESGIAMVPYMLTSAFFSLAAGVFVSKNGLFAPPTILGCAISTIGSGFLASLQPHTSTAFWAGAEVVVATGLGLAVQQGLSAVQATLPYHEIPIGTAAVVACQSAGGAVFISIGNTLLQKHLFNANTSNTIPGVSVRLVFELGATNFRDHVSPEALSALLSLYNDALQAVFKTAVPLCGLAFVFSLAMEWRSLKVEDLFSTSAAKLDLEHGNREGCETPELGSDASTLRHLDPRARAKWNQRCVESRSKGSHDGWDLSVVPELDISEKTMVPFEINDSEIGMATSV